VTDLLEAGEPEHVIEAVTGHLSRRLLEHYSHRRLKAKGQMLTRMEERRKKKESPEPGSESYGGGSLDSFPQPSAKCNRGL
jgi:hypothetical protein